MSKLAEIALEKLIAPLVLLLLTPAATALASKLKTGSWTAAFSAIPVWIYYVVGAAFIFWIVIVLLRRRARHVRHLNEPVVAPFSIPMFGYVQVGELTHHGVRWRMLALSPAPWDRFDPQAVSSGRITVQSPPRCPKCDTELEQHARFFGGYRWSCIRCGFHVKARQSFYLEEDRAKRLAESHWNEQFNRRKA